MSRQPVSLDKLAGQLATRTNQINSGREGAMPSVAQLIGKDSADYPWMKADVRAAISFSGAPQAVRDQIAQSAAQGALKDPRLAQLEELKKAKKVKKKFSWTSPSDLLKGAGRYGLAAVSAPFEVAQNVTGAGFDLMDKYGIGPTGTLNLWTNKDQQAARSGASLGSVAKDIGQTASRVGNAFEASTLAQGVDHSSEQGDGFFMGKGVMDRQAAAAKEVRGTTKGGHAWTLGRYLASTANTNVELLKEDSKGYDLVSGMTDVWASFALDPLNVARGFKAPIEITEVTAKSRGAGRIGNAILDTRKAKEAGRTAEVGRLSGLMDEARATAEQADELAGKLVAASDAAAGVNVPASKLYAQQAQQALARGAEWRSYLTKVADEAESLDAVGQAMASRSTLASLGLKAEDAARTDYTDMVRRNVGLVSHPKYGQQVVGTQAMRSLLSHEGQRMVEYVAGEGSATRIMALWKGKMPLKVAQSLADAQSPSGVVRALGAGLEVSGGLRKVETVGRWGGIKVGERMLAEIPGDVKASRRLLGQAARAGDARINFSKPDEAFGKVYNLLGNAKVTGAERNQVMDKLVRTLTSDNVGAFHYATRGLRGQMDLDAEIGAFEKVMKAGAALGADDLTRYEQLLEAKKVADDFQGVQGAIAKSVREQFYSVKAGQTAADLKASGRDGLAAKVKQLVNDIDVDFIMKDPTRDVDKMSAYTAQSMQDFDPQFLNGPVMVTQLLNDDLHLMDPDAVREVAQRVSALSRLTLGPTGSMRRMPVSMLEAFQEEVWRVPVILRPALGVRMLAEEAIRTAFGGSMRGVGDMIAGFMRAGKSVDALGVRIDAASRLDELELTIAKLESIPGKADEIAALKDEVRATTAMLDDGKRVLSEGMGGKRGYGHLDAIKTKLGGDEGDLVRTGNWAIVRRPDLDPRQARRYRQALIDELHSMAADPVMKRIANGGLFPGDAIGRRVLSAGEATDLNDVEAWLTQGAGQKYWAEYAANKAWDVNDATKMREWIAAQQETLRYSFGNSEEAQAAVASGYMRGQKLAQPDRWGRSEHGKELREWAKEFASTPEAPENARYEMTLNQLRGSKDSRHKAAFERYSQFTSAAFAAIYSNKSDTLYRIPMFARRYWDEMESMLPKLAREDALRAVSNAEKDGLIPATQLARMKTLAETANGSGLLDEADQLAKGWALDDIKKLFFKADRDGYAVDRARLVFPFARAFAEVLTTWSRIISEDPTGIARSFNRGVTGLRDAGVFHQDERGNEVFTFPLTGELTKLTLGVNAPFTGEVKNLNMVGSLLPSFGPVASIPAYFIAENAPLPQSALSMMFPFGRPKAIDDQLIPPWAAKLRSAWNHDEAEQIYGNTLFKVTQALMASGRYGDGNGALSNEAQARLLDDAQDKARALTALRGFIQFLGPTAPSPQYVAETGQGDVTMAKMMADYQVMFKMPQEQIEALGYDDADSMFLDKYGDTNMSMIVGRASSQTTGWSATHQFMDWRNGDGRYPAKAHPEVYGYLGPDGGKFSINAQQTLIRSGDLENRSVNDLLAIANSRLASNRYEDAVADLEAMFPNPTAKQQAAIDAKLTEVRDDLKQQFPGYSPESGGLEGGANTKRKLDAVKAMAADEKLADNPTVKALRTYYAAQNYYAEQAKAKTKSSLNSKKAKPYLDNLLDSANALAAQDEGFKRLWRDVLKNEYSVLKRTTGGK